MLIYPSASGLSGFETKAWAAVDGKVRAWLKCLGCAGVELQCTPCKRRHLEDQAAAQRRFRFQKSANLRRTSKSPNFSYALKSPS
jgi:hypothetical protein